MSDDFAVTFMGKKIEDLSKEELLFCVQHLINSERRFNDYSDNVTKEENKRLIRENEKLWDCLKNRK
jgi:hypothetical protein